MAFDFKKEYKEFYQPKGKPQVVTVPLCRKWLRKRLLGCSHAS